MLFYTSILFYIMLQVLFLKNLSSKVTREDLVALFNRYHKTTGETTEYKLMTGRMKGQAFVTFQSKFYLYCLTMQTKLSRIYDKEL